MRKLRIVMALGVVGVLLLFFGVHIWTGVAIAPSADEEEVHGRLERIRGVRVLHLWGTPEQMGHAHGTLLKDLIPRVIDDVLDPEGEYSDYPRIIAGTRIMEKYQPEPFRREMKALATAAGVDYMDVVALQLFGDALRGRLPGEDDPPGDGYQCTNYAVFGPATSDGELVAGRNFDYYFPKVASYASTVIHYRPDEGHPFVTLSWAGVVNGWTLMNTRGLLAANNNGYSTNESLEGISTCFMQRKLVQFADDLDEAIEMARKGPRAVGTIMLVAQATPARAVELEYDHLNLVVRQPERGVIIATNSFRKLGVEGRFFGNWGRYAAMTELVETHYGKITLKDNFVADPRVHQGQTTLHTVMLRPMDGTFTFALGAGAGKGPFHTFRLTEQRVEAVR